MDHYFCAGCGDKFPRTEPHHLQPGGAHPWAPDASRYYAFCRRKVKMVGKRLDESETCLPHLGGGNARAGFSAIDEPAGGTIRGVTLKKPIPQLSGPNKDTFNLMVYDAP